MNHNENQGSSLTDKIDNLGLSDFKKVEVRSKNKGTLKNTDDGQIISWLNWRLYEFKFDLPLFKIVNVNFYLFFNPLKIQYLHQY